MPKYQVTWKELRYVFCSSEVVADNEKEAVEKAQAYTEHVYECPGDTYDIFEGEADLIEE